MNSAYIIVIAGNCNLSQRKLGDVDVCGYFSKCDEQRQLLFFKVKNELGTWILLTE